MPDANQEALLLFQIGSVQEFIAQAECVGDLAAGSELLSRVMAAALRSVPEFTEKTVFPAVEGNEALKGIPNRFLVFVPRDEAKAIAERAETAARDALRSIAQPTAAMVENQAAFWQQVDAFLQITWVILETPTGKMGEDYKAIGKLMALRRNTREFAQWEEPGGVEKDFLSGKENSVDAETKLGAMNLIKRNLAKTITLDRPQYFGVIAMDGDHMGAALSDFETRSEHLAFSTALAKFAVEAAQIAEGRGATLIYAGGDDVLAAISADKAFDFACQLRKAFEMYMGPQTASAGIAIAHCKTPLQDVVHAAHAAESRAKHHYGRNALAVNIYKRSGEILEWGCKWGSNAFAIYAALTKASASLAGFSHKLARFLEPYGLDGPMPKDMEPVVIKDTLHALQQTESAKAVLEEKILEDYLGEEATKAHAEDFLKLFLCETFINRPRGEED